MALTDTDTGVAVAVVARMQQPTVFAADLASGSLLWQVPRWISPFSISVSPPLPGSSNNTALVAVLDAFSRDNNTIYIFNSATGVMVNAISLPNNTLVMDQQGEIARSPLLPHRAWMLAPAVPKCCMVRTVALINACARATAGAA